jgi:hypothetical protein
MPRFEKEMAPGVLLIGGRFLQKEAQPGDSVSFELYWQASAPIEHDYFLVATILGRGHGALTGLHDTPGGGSYPTSLWEPGQPFVSRYTLRLPAAMQAPTLGRLLVYLEGPSGTPPPADELFLDQLAVHGDARPTPAHPILARLGGYDLERTPDQIAIILYWQAITATDQDWQVFLHLEDPTGAPLAQGDGPPVGGDYPTYVWQPGEWIDDRHVIALPPELPAGTYRLTAGLYDLATLHRLPAHDDAERRFPHDSVPLGEIPLP